MADIIRSQLGQYYVSESEKELLRQDGPIIIWLIHSFYLYLTIWSVSPH